MSSSSGSSSGPSSALGSEPDDVSDSDSASPSGSVSAGSPSASASSVSSSPPSSSSSSPSPSASASGSESPSSQQDSPVVEEQSTGSSSESASMPAESDSLGSASYDLSSSSSGSGSTSGPSVSETGSSSNGPIEGDGSASPASPPMDDGESGSSESSSHSSSSNPASGSTNVSESSESGTRSDDEGDDESSSDSPPTPPLPVPAEAQQEQEVDFTPPGTPKNKPKKKKGFFSRLFGKKKDKGKENDKPKAKSRKGDKVPLQTLEQDSTSSHELIESPQSHSHTSPEPHHSPSVSPSASASASSNSNSVSNDSPSLSSPIPTPPSTPHGSESSGSSSSSASSSSSESPDDEGGEGLVASNVSGEGSEGEVSESVASNSAERTPSSSGSDSVSAKAEVQVSANLEESESLDSPPHSDSVEGDLASAHSSPSTSAVSASLSSGSLSGSSDTGPSDSGSSEEHVDPHSTSSSSSEKVVLAVPLPLSVSGEGSSSSSKDASAKSGSPSPSSSSSTSKSEVSENGDGSGSASASDSDSSSSSSGGEVVDLTESEDPEHDDSSSLPQPRPSVNVHDIEDSNSESPPQVTTPNSPEEIESEEEDTISLPPFKKLSFWGKIRRKFGGKKAEKKRKAKKLGLTYPRVKTQRTPSPPPASPSPRNSPPSDSGPSASSKSGSHESPSLSRSAASGSASAHPSTSSASNSNSTHSSVSGSGVSSGSGTGTPSVSASHSPTTSSSGEGAVGVAVVSVPGSDSHSLSSATPSHSGTSLSASASSSASASPSPSPSPSPSHSTSSASSHIEEGGTTVAVVALPSGSSASASASSSHSSSSSASASPSASPSASSNHSLSESSASDFGASSSSKISISGAPEDDEEPSIVETITPTPKKNEPLQRDFSFALTIGKLEPSTPVKRRTGAFMRVESHARPSSVSATKKRMKDISRSVSIAGGPRSTRTVVPPTPGKQKSGDFTMSGVVAATHSPGRQGLVRVTSMALREEKERELSGIQKENSSPVGKITPLSTKRRGVSSGPQSPESRERSRKVSVMGESDVNGGKGKGKRGSVAVVDSLKWIPKAEPSPPNELVAASDNWVVEDSKKKLNWFDLFNPRHLNIIETNALRDFENYFEGKSHSNYIGSHGNHGAFLLSVKNDRESVITNEDKPTRAGIAGVRAKLHKEPPKQAFRALLRDREGDTRLWLYTKSLPKTNKAVRVAVSLANDKLEWVKTSRLKRIKAALHQHRLVLLEQKFAQNAIKVGVIYAKSGQKKESAMLANTKGSAEFNDFLGFMGDFVRLKGWKKYAGGLDTENNLTGTHSICTTFEDIEVMFHVSTLLPTPPDDPQCISKKLHIGNDVIVIIWLDDYSAKFKPESLVSKFNHVYIIIQPAESKDLTRSYVRVTVCTKYGVETADPKFPPGTIFERNGMFRQLLLAKIINSEKLAYQSEGFSAMTENIRYQNLFNLYQEYFLKKPTLQQPISRVAGGSSMFTRSLSKKFTHNG